MCHLQSVLASTLVAASRTFTTTIVRDGSMCFIPLTFDPREVFGKVRAPVKVTVNGYTYRSTIAAMGGPPAWARWQELSYSHQREYVQAIEDAQKPETRTRRLTSAVREIKARPRRTKKGKSS